MESYSEKNRPPEPVKRISYSSYSLHKPSYSLHKPSKAEVIQKSKDLLLDAVSNKLSYSDRNEIINSFYVNACVIDSTSASVHATFKLRGLTNAYSVELKVENGLLTPTQIYYDNGITPPIYGKK